MRAAAILLIVLTRLAAADTVTDAITKMQSNASVRERVAAEITLVRSGDARAIPVLADTLLHEQDTSLRRVAAVGLGKLVTSSSSSSDLQQALAALARASRQDKNRRVRRSAKTSYGQLQQHVVPAKATYLDVGTIAAPKGYAAAAKEIRRTIRHVLAKQTAVQTTTSGPGIHIELTTSFSASSTATSCEVHVVMATYPASKVLGSFVGRASVQDVTIAAASDCATAVVESLLIHDVLPSVAKRAARAKKVSRSAASTTTQSTSP
jgi:hypothetical protein